MLRVSPRRDTPISPSSRTSPRLRLDAQHIRIPTPAEGERRVNDPRGTDALSAADIDKRREAARRASAASIRPGCLQWVLTSWKPKETKPMKEHLHAEMLYRMPRFKGKTWEAQRLADVLHETEPKVLIFPPRVSRVIYRANCCLCILLTGRGSPLVC